MTKIRFEGFKEEMAIVRCNAENQDYNPLVVKPLVQGRNNYVTHKEVRGTGEGVLWSSSSSKEGPPPLRIPSCQHLSTRPKKDLADLYLLRIEGGHFELITKYRLPSVLNQQNLLKNQIDLGISVYQAEGDGTGKATKRGYGQVYDASLCNFHVIHKKWTCDNEINTYSCSDALNFEEAVRDFSKYSPWQHTLADRRRAQRKEKRVTKGDKSKARVEKTVNFLLELGGKTTNRDLFCSTDVNNRDERNHLKKPEKLLKSHTSTSRPTATLSGLRHRCYSR
ncbi:hypothetical protein J6590_103309 [Homalodisca vitripennis]|nr:hypothetical protein J6590_103309 [Homalodisca vitripennis]